MKDKLEIFNGPRLVFQPYRSNFFPSPREKPTLLPIIRKNMSNVNRLSIIMSSLLLCLYLYTLLVLHLAEALVERVEECAPHGNEIGLEGLAQTYLCVTEETDIVQVDDKRLVALLKDGA